MRSTQVALRAGITYRQLDYWTRTGLVPMGRPGPGVERIWEPHQVARVCAIAAWVHLGVLASRAAALVDAGHEAPELAQATAS